MAIITDVAMVDNTADVVVVVDVVVAIADVVFETNDKLTCSNIH